MTWPYVSQEIAATAISTLDADDYVGISGTLGVATREIRIPQPEAKPRAYAESAMPAIEIGMTSDASDPMFCMTQGHAYKLECVVTVRNGDMLYAQGLNCAIRDAALVAIRKAADGSQSWLASGYPTIAPSSTAGEPVSDAADPYTFRSESTIDLTVLLVEGEL